MSDRPNSQNHETSARDRTREKLFNNLNDRHYDKPLARRELAQYLMRENDIGAVEFILSRFDRKLLLEHLATRLELHLPENLAQVTPAIYSLYDFMHLMHTLHEARPTLNSFKEAIYPLILNKWSTMVGWLGYLLVRIDTSTPHVTLIVGTAEELVRATFAVYGLESDHGEELLSLPCTMDFIYLIICQGDPETGKGLPAEATTGLLSVALACLISGANHPSFMTRLNTLPPATQRALVSALSSRPPVLVAAALAKDLDPTTNIGLLGMSLLSGITTCFMQTNPSMWPFLKRRRFIFEFCKGISTISRHARARGVTDITFWKHSANTSLGIYFLAVKAPQRSDALGEALSGGLMISVFSSLRYLDPASNEYTFIGVCIREISHHYMTVSKVLRALSWVATYPQQELDGLCDGTEEVRKWRNLFIVIFRQSYSAFGVEGELSSPIHCDNLGHRIQSPNCADHHSATGIGKGQKICAACHSLTYCCAECQEHDWERFHKRECSALSALYRKQRSKGFWASSSTRRDQLIFIDYCLNTLVSRDSEVKWEPKCILVLDAFNFNGVGTLSLSVEQCRSAIWNHVDPLWLPRTEEFVKNMLEDESTRLVEGIFFHHSDQAVTILAKIQYDEQKEEGRRFKVLNAIFRPCSFAAIAAMVHENRTRGLVMQHPD